LLIRCHRVVVEPNWGWFEDEVRRVHPLHGVVTNEHHAVQNRVVSRDLCFEVLYKL
jgi:hypothetical protein